jgi:transposase
MSDKAVGIDVSKAKLSVAVYDGTGYRTATFDNDRGGFRRLAKWLKKQGGRGAHVCLESTGSYGEAAALYLHERGYPVSVVNPARVKAYGQSQLKRNKNDREDARVIAHFCATQAPTLWTPPPPEVKELQALTRHRESLVADRTREKNHQQAGGLTAIVKESIQSHIDFLDEEIAAIDKLIEELIDKHPDLHQQRELLTTIPGISDKTATKFMAEVPDVLRFDSAKQLAAYAGLTPRQHHSGASVHRPGRLAKTGSQRLRTAFYMPALAAMRSNPIVQALAVRLDARGKSRMTVVGAAMRKLLHLAYGVLKTGQPFDPNYLAELPEIA